MTEGRAPGPAWKALVVDDEVDGLRAIERWLTHFGWDVTATVSPRVALRHLAEEAFGLVVTDLHMPGLSGVDVARAARRVSSVVRIVLLTADPLGVKDADRSLFDAILEKPATMTELRRCALPPDGGSRPSGVQRRDRLPLTTADGPHSILELRDEGDGELLHVAHLGARPRTEEARESLHALGGTVPRRALLLDLRGSDDEDEAELRLRFWTRVAVSVGLERLGLVVRDPRAKARMNVAGALAELPSRAFLTVEDASAWLAVAPGERAGSS